MRRAVTTMKGDVAAKLGIGPCSFSSRDRAGDDNEVPAGAGHDLDHASRGYFGIGGGGHVLPGGAAIGGGFAAKGMQDPRKTERRGTDHEHMATRARGRMRP